MLVDIIVLTIIQKKVKTKNKKKQQGQQQANLNQRNEDEIDNDNNDDERMTMISQITTKVDQHPEHKQKQQPDAKDYWDEFEK